MTSPIFFIFILLVCILETSKSLRIYNRVIGTRMMATSSPVDIQAQGMDLTDGLKSRVTSKIGKVLNKLGSDAVSTKVVLKVVANDVNEVHAQTTKKNSQIVEATIQTKNGAAVHTSQGTDDMYASIDLISHKLAQSLKKHNEKLRSTKRKGSKDAEVLTAEELAEDDFNTNELLEELDDRYKSLIEP